MGENLPEIKDDTVALESHTSVNERETDWQKGLEEGLAQLHSEMYTWLTYIYQRPSHYNGGEEGEFDF